MTLLSPACADDLHLEPVVLPVAPQGEEDKADDPDPRVVVNLLASGEMRHGGERVHLTRFGAILKGLRKERGEGLERASKLFVLIRADRDVEWKRVLWVMTVCAENYIYRLQLGVKLAADRSYTQEAATELDVKRRDIEAPAVPELEGKLCLHLTHWMHKRHVVFYALSIDHTPKEGAVYEFAEGETTDLSTVRVWAAETWKALRDVRGVARVARVRADGDVPLRYVVAAISKLREAGWLEIDYFFTSIPKVDLKELRYDPWK